MQLSYDYAKDRALMCLRANYESHLRTGQNYAPIPAVADNPDQWIKTEISLWVAPWHARKKPGIAQPLLQSVEYSIVGEPAMTMRLRQCSCAPQVTIAHAPPIFRRSVETRSNSRSIALTDSSLDSTEGDDTARKRHHGRRHLVYRASLAHVQGEEVGDQPLGIVTSEPPHEIRVKNA